MSFSNSHRRILKGAFKALAELCVILELVAAAMSPPLCTDAAACRTSTAALSAIATWPIVF